MAKRYLQIELEYETDPLGWSISYALIKDILRTLPFVVVTRIYDAPQKEER